MKMGATIRADYLSGGEVTGRVTKLGAPLSLWGGFDPVSGTVTDVNHPDHGASVSGRVLVMPGGRGSSSSSSVLLESARLGRHPLAIVLAEPDPILAVGALVAADLYGVHIPVVCVPADFLSEIGANDTLHITAEPGNACVVRLSKNSDF